MVADSDYTKRLMKQCRDHQVIHHSFGSALAPPLNAAERGAARFGDPCRAVSIPQHAEYAPCDLRWWNGFFHGLAWGVFFVSFIGVLNIIFGAGS